MQLKAVQFLSFLFRKESFLSVCNEECLLYQHISVNTSISYAAHNKQALLHEISMAYS